VRAFRAATSNAPGDAFVRHGAKHSEVCITGPNFEIEWRKGGGLNDFKVNKEDFFSVGAGGVPQPVIDLGFRKLSLLGGKEELDVQVTDQFQPLFLLHESGNVAAAALSDAERADQLRTCQELSEKKRRDARSEKRVREKDLQQVELELSILNNLDLDLVETNLVNLNKELQDISLVLSNLKDLQGKITTLQELVSSLSFALSSLPPLPPIDDYNLELNIISSLDINLKKAQSLSSTITSYTLLSTLPDVPSTDPMVDANTELIVLYDTFSKLNKLDILLKRPEALNQLQVPNISEFETLDSMLVEQTSTQDKYKTYTNLQTLLKEGIKNLTHLKDNLASLEATITEEEKRLSLCPTCGQPFKQGEGSC
jgi:hypothetical protein